jgi:hypothetical protein
MVVIISLSFAWRQQEHPASVPSKPLPIADRTRGKSLNKLSHITAKKEKLIKKSKNMNLYCSCHRRPDGDREKQEGEKPEGRRLHQGFPPS